MELLRIQKYLSQSWICSRRKAEEYIKEWLLKINWKIAEIWQSINQEIDKNDIKFKKYPFIFWYFKSLQFLWFKKKNFVIG